MSEPSDDDVKTSRTGKRNNRSSKSSSSNTTSSSVSVQSSSQHTASGSSGLPIPDYERRNKNNKMLLANPSLGRTSTTTTTPSSSVSVARSTQEELNRAAATSRQHAMASRGQNAKTSPSSSRTSSSRTGSGNTKSIGAISGAVSSNNRDRGKSPRPPSTNASTSNGRVKSPQSSNATTSRASRHQRNAAGDPLRTDSLNTIPRPPSALRRADGANHNAVLTPGAQAVSGDIYGNDIEHNNHHDALAAAAPPPSFADEGGTTTIMDAESDGIILTEATKVNEIYATETVDVKRQNWQERKRRRRLFILGFISASLLVGGIVTASILLTRPAKATDAPTSAPTMAPTFTESGIREFVETSLTAPTNLQDLQSPQSRALDWLIEQNELGSPLSDPDILTQRFVLAVLYYSTNGDGTWLSKRNWMDPNRSVCEWASSASLDNICNTEGLLLELKLDRNQLQGTIPTELAHLGKQLQVLDLTSNALEGTIPTELGLLSNVEILFLSLNLLEGTVPTELGQLSSVRQLYFDSNSFIAPMPAQVCDLQDTTLDKLWADCEEVDCTCCGKCCSDAEPCNTIAGGT